MARPRKTLPRYLLHTQTGRGRLLWTDSLGLRQEQMLPGEFMSEESLAAKARLELELATSPNRTTRADQEELSVNEVLAAYMDFAPTHYRDADGSPTSELCEIRWSLRFVRELYGMEPARDFGPLALEVVREKMIRAGWCRSVINKRVDRVKRAWKWAVSKEKVPPTAHQALSALSGLRIGRSEAPDSEPIKPVDPATVAATMPKLNRHLRTMIELQQLSGMRPGEVCRMKLSEIDRTSSPWTYRPRKHKTQHRGGIRVVMLGPRAQAAIEAFVAGGTVVDPTAPLFSPRRAREERFAEMRAKRKSKVTPSQVCRRKAKPELLPAEQYTPHSYAQAVRKAAAKAGAEHWCPLQLRHTFATQARKRHGLEAAQVLLGHARADVSQVYAERNEELAASVATKIG